MIRNGADIWETLCQEAVGCDSNGDAVAKVTMFGAIAQSHGLVLSSYQIGRKYQWANLTGDMKPNREAVVSFLREWADAIEAGK